MKRRLSLFIGLSLLGLLTTGVASAAGVRYPRKPVRWIVPYSAGGPTDRLARVVGEALTEKWGQQIVVDVRPGANSIIGTTIAARATPDGYTMLIALPAIAINPWIHRKLPYNAMQDLAPVSLIASAGYVMVIYPSLPATSLRQFIALAKRQPGKFSFGSGGIGSPAQLAMALLDEITGMKMVHVPYKGGAPALADLMAGHIQAMVNPALSSLPLIRAGKLRALAVTSVQRSALLPDVPTVAESIGKPYDVSTWYGLFTPAKTPPSVIAKVRDDLAAVLKEPLVRNRLTSFGAIPSGDTPRAFRAFLKKEMVKWHDMVKAAGIEPR